ncbi:YfiR family protein [Denitromonas iodatirespirans]|uniref:YfiR family protein n=1 Tax=Denitromonas iodatirespirans TaxID=2795389 RepID=A0A944D8U6_DENI1|nr:YfiR family protein [Denitromonas iodatirespirans]MBT0960762.1 YfiR family protein [Denitromonas iodatirespirans]
MQTRDHDLGLPNGQAPCRALAPTPRPVTMPADISPPGTRQRCRNLLAGLLLLACLPVFAIGQPNTRIDPRIVQAAFLRNFAHYVTWPDNAFADERSPWRICVLGNDPFGNALESTLAGRTEQGRPFAIFRAKRLEDLQRCQIVYVAHEATANRRATLAALKDKPVLTVSSAPDFLQEGGIIRFQITDYVEMSVNLDQARAASLTIPTKMLEVSTGVVENGVVRKVR